MLLSMLGLRCFAVCLVCLVGLLPINGPGNAASSTTRSEWYPLLAALEWGDLWSLRAGAQGVTVVVNATTEGVVGIQLDAVRGTEASFEGPLTTQTVAGLSLAKETLALRRVGAARLVFDDWLWTEARPESGGSTTIDKQFTYADDCNWLLDIAVSDGSAETFAYHPFGTLRDHHRYVNNGQLASHTRYEHDAFLRITSKVEQHYTPGAVPTPTNRTEHSYDYVGASWMRSHHRISGGPTTTMSYDDDFKMISATVDGLRRSYAHAPGLQWHTAQQAGGPSTLNAHLSDGRGNIRGHYSITADVGAPGGQRAGLSAWFRYDAWGQVQELRPASGIFAPVTPSAGLRYRGQWYDGGDEGDYRMGHRFYNPRLGRFNRSDPAEAGVNWYAYAGGDPVNRWDPTGLYWELVGSGESAQWEWRDGEVPMNLRSGGLWHKINGEDASSFGTIIDSVGINVSPTRDEWAYIPSSAFHGVADTDQFLASKKEELRSDRNAIRYGVLLELHQEAIQQNEAKYTQQVAAWELRIAEAKAAQADFVDLGYGFSVRMSEISDPAIWNENLKTSIYALMTFEVRGHIAGNELNWGDVGIEGIKQGAMTVATFGAAKGTQLAWRAYKLRSGANAAIQAEKRARILARRAEDAARAAKWTPHPGFQMPGADKGRFLGDLGNSPFALSDDAAAAMGVPRGTSIPWREGIPDFGVHAVPGPGGIPGTFNVTGLTGAHATDRTLMLKQMAAQSGMSQRAVQQWLSTNNVRLHHSGGQAIQIVPAPIHGLHHSGGAQQLRGGN